MRREEGGLAGWYHGLKRGLTGHTPHVDLSGGRWNEDGSSFSGHERNHLFVSQGAERFHDLSGLSGADSPFDARSFVVWDFDRDGWNDFAAINANEPLLEVFHNRLGRAAEARGAGGILAFRFVGSRSNRDGIGCRVRVGLGDQVLLREHAAGVGRASQNSATLLVGIGAAAQADWVEVRFPSGVVHRLEGLAEGQLVTVHEDPASSPAGEVFEIETYRRTSGEPGGIAPRAGEATRVTLADPRVAAERAPLRLYTTMATWCTSCRGEVPRLQHLRELFPAEQLAMFAIPVDAADTDAMLAGWMDELEPPYVLLDVDGDEVAAVEDLVVDRLGGEGTPATLLTDASGEVLWVQWGPPTVSKLRELLHETH